MKEMQLFEVGFKEYFWHPGYFEKFYIVAENSEEAEGKARKWLEDDAAEWDGDGDPKAKKKYMGLIASLRLTRMQHIGKAIV